MAVKNLLIRTVLISATFTLVLSPVLSANEKNNSATDSMVAFVPFQKWILEASKNAKGKNIEVNDEINGFTQNSDDGAIQGASDRVSISSTFKTNLLNASNDKNLNIQLSMIETKISANNLKLAVTVQKDLGFGTATLHLQYQCESLNISVKNQSAFDLLATIQRGQISAQNISWDFAQTSSQIELNNCSGTTGIDQQIKEQIDQFLKSKMIAEVLQKVVNQKINIIVAEQLMKTLQKYQNEFKIGSNLAQHFDEGNNLWIESGVDPLSTFKSEEIEKLKAQTEISFLIKKENLESLVQEKLNEILITKNLLSTENTELQRLTCSRWTQTFVWPSLKSLKKCFELVIQSRIQKVSLNDIENKQFEIQLSSWALGDNQNLAYFSSSLKISSNPMQLEIQAFSGVANPEFIKSSGRSSRISTKLIQSALAPWLTNALKNFSDSEVFKIFDQKTKFIKTTDSFIVQLN